MVRLIKHCNKDEFKQKNRIGNCISRSKITETADLFLQATYFWWPDQSNAFARIRSL